MMYCGTSQDPQQDLGAADDQHRDQSDRADLGPGRGCRRAPRSAPRVGDRDRAIARRGLFEGRNPVAKLAVHGAPLHQLDIQAGLGPGATVDRSLDLATSSKKCGCAVISSGRGRGERSAKMLASRPGRGAMTMIRSARNTASSMLWVMKTMVLPVSSQISWSRRFISSRVKASSAPNGSSISSTDGSTESARTIAARCCMPPESSRGYLLSKPSRPTRFSSSSIRSRCASGFCP